MQIFEKLRSLSKEKQYGILLFVGVFVVFAYTAARTHVSFADSDEFSVIGYQLGVAHAPGYPLYILLVFLFEHLIPFGSIAYRANLTSALLDSACVSGVYMTSVKLFEAIKVKRSVIRKKHEKPKAVYELIYQPVSVTMKIMLSLIASLLLAFSFSFWLYSNVSEVFALNNLFVVIIVYLVLSIRERSLHARYGTDIPGGRTDDRVFVLLCLLVCMLGLALTHLQTIILIYPVVIVYTIYVLRKGRHLCLLRSMKRVGILMVIAVLSFCLPFGLLLLFSRTGASVSWSLGNGLQGLLADMTRQAYGDGSAHSLSAYSVSFDLVKGVESIPSYITLLIQDFTIVPVLLALCGMVFLWIKQKGTFFFLSALFLFSGIVYVTYTQIPPVVQNDMVATYGNLAIAQRQFIMSEVILSLFIASGLWGLYELIVWVNRKQQAVLLINQFLVLLFCFLLIGSVGYEVWENGGQANMNTFSYIDSYARASLDGTNRNSVVMCFSDITCFSYLYAQQIEHIRSDDVIIPYTYDLRKEYVDKMKSISVFSYTNTDDTIASDIAVALYRHRSVYVADVPGSYVSYVGLDGQAFYMIPDGYLQQVVTTIPATVPARSFAIAQKLAASIDSLGAAKGKNNWEKAILGTMVRDSMLDAYLYWEEGHITQADTLTSLSYRLRKGFPVSAPIAQVLQGYATPGTYVPGSAIQSSSELFQAAQSQSSAQLAFEDTRDSVFEDPFNIPARLYLANLYAQNRDYVPLAREEYENVLRIDPNNKTALQSLGKYGYR